MELPENYHILFISWQFDLPICITRITRESLDLTQDSIQFVKALMVMYVNVFTKFAGDLL